MFECADYLRTRCRVMSKPTSCLSARDLPHPYVMLFVMRELLKPLLDSVTALKTQMLAAISIPLAETNQFGERDNAAIDRMDSCDVQKPVGSLFDCVTEHPGRMTRNGRGSLEIGAAHDD